MKLRRERTGLTQETAAEAMGGTCTASSWRNWELGVSVPRPGTRPKIARVLGVSLAEAASWFGGQAATAPNGVVPGWMGHFAELEQGAGEIRTYEPMAVPGLLQTADYAAAVQRTDTVEGRPSEAEVDRWVQHRLARQEVLHRAHDPLRLAAVIDEAVLYRIAGDGEVMAGQLEHLAKMAEQPNVDLRILRLDASTFAAVSVAFTVFASPGADAPYMVVTVDRTTAHYLELEFVVQKHAKLFEHLQQVAVSGAGSTDLIRAAIRERYS